MVVSLIDDDDGSAIIAIHHGGWQDSGTTVSSASDGAVGFIRRGRIGDLKWLSISEMNPPRSDLCDMD